MRTTPQTQLPPAPATPSRRAMPQRTEILPLWAHLPPDRRRQLTDLLGQLLARLHEAQRAGEGGHD